MWRARCERPSASGHHVPAWSPPRGRPSRCGRALGMDHGQRGRQRVDRGRVHVTDCRTYVRSRRRARRTTPPMYGDGRHGTVPQEDRPGRARTDAGGDHLPPRGAGAAGVCDVRPRRSAQRAARGAARPGRGWTPSPPRWPSARRPRHVGDHRAGQPAHRARHDIDALERRPAAPGTDAAIVGELRDGQVRLATEQARYQIAFREDLARLADQLKRRG